MSTVTQPGASTVAVRTQAAEHVSQSTLFGILAAISICHFLNDTVQSLLPAIYPILKNAYQLNYQQVGLITLSYQVTASLLQPLVGLYTDYRPKPFSLPVGMACTLTGLISLSRAHSFEMILISAALMGTGSAVFHPESSRVARLASGGQHGLAQSIFQVGGNAGSSLGPLLAAFIVVPRGQHSISWFSLVVVLAMVILVRVSIWKKNSGSHQPVSRAAKASVTHPSLSKGKVAGSVAILISLIFSKHFYLASLGSYYTFYLMNRFHLSIQNSQVHLFVFLGSAAVGTIVGGPIGDRIGRKYVIWCSILGVLPFTLMLPYANLFWTTVLTVIIGLTLASAFPAILVYAQELIPGRIGMISGLFFGLAFGMGGLGAAVLGKLADRTSIDFVYHVCSFLPAIGLLTAFLPDIEKRQRAHKPA
jgi:FSR family fosmidomycin resistance protein-like MFS transporter